MTDKKIIIDGIDVTGCEWISEVGLDSEYICNCNSPNKTSGYCKYNPNCCYKQLKRKEQECERLEEERNEYFELMAIRTEVLAKIANKLGMNTGIIENKELFCKIDQLKAENEELKRQHQADKGLITSIGKMNYQLIQEYDKLKTALTEIKELLLKTPTDSPMHCINAKSVILQKISECEVMDEL